MGLCVRKGVTPHRIFYSLFRFTCYSDEQTLQTADTVLNDNHKKRKIPSQELRDVTSFHSAPQIS